MSPASRDTLADPQQVIADLRCELSDAQERVAERTVERDDALARVAAVAAERDEALAQQTATAEVLQVINSSPGDLAPVFDAMLERAMSLCDASMGVFARFDGNRFKPAVSRGVPPRYAEYLATTSDQPSPEGTNQRVLAGENVVHVIDVSASATARATLGYAR